MTRPGRSPAALPTVPLLVVSPRKSGTHLLKNLLTAIGYVLHGDVAATTAESAHYRGQRLLDVLVTVLDEDELVALQRCTDPAEVQRTITTALNAYFMAWRAWLGSHRFVPGDGDTATVTLATRLLAAPHSAGFTEQPADLAWILHHLDPRDAHPDFMSQWCADGTPRVLLNVRDPRDCLVSMVRFLAADGPDDQVGAFPEHLHYRRVLRGLDSVHDRLRLAITDPDFPGLQDFERSLWLRDDPRVAVVRYEDLVGPQGGGSADRQRLAIGTVLAAAGVTADPQALVRALDSRTSFTFRRGRIGGYREVFTTELAALFEHRHGHLLDHLLDGAPDSTPTRPLPTLGR